MHFVPIVRCALSPQSEMSSRVKIRVSRPAGVLLHQQYSAGNSPPESLWPPDAFFPVLHALAFDLPGPFGRRFFYLCLGRVPVFFQSGPGLPSGHSSPLCQLYLPDKGNPFPGTSLSLLLLQSAFPTCLFKSLILRSHFTWSLGGDPTLPAKGLASQPLHPLFRLQRTVLAFGDFGGVLDQDGGCRVCLLIMALPCPAAWARSPHWLLNWKRHAQCTV